MTSYPEEQPKVDLREVLTEFWLGVIHDPGVDLPEKIKCSEALAKHILGDGKGVTARRKIALNGERMSTADVLRAVAELEEQGEDDGR